MKIYLILLIIVIVCAIGLYFYSKEDVTDEKSLKEKLASIQLSEFKKRWPKIDRLTFIEIRNALRHYPDNITEDYLKDILYDG